mmetsp:Transcript_5428/g.21483  ORF Transcript_5428/g.21483 Transcript_5428/m.21483 type:complete len:246 (-) Transcript_5428:1388-2125(-)
MGPARTATRPQAPCIPRLTTLPAREPAAKTAVAKYRRLPPTARTVGRPVRQPALGGNPLRTGSMPRNKLRWRLRNNSTTFGTISGRCPTSLHLFPPTSPSCRRTWGQLSRKRSGEGSPSPDWTSPWTEAQHATRVRCRAVVRASCLCRLRRILSPSKRVERVGIRRPCRRRASSRATASTISLGQARRYRSLGLTSEVLARLIRPRPSEASIRCRAFRRSRCCPPPSGASVTKAFRTTNRAGAIS